MVCYIRDDMNSNWRPDGEMLMMYRYGSMTGFLGVLAPSESVKDRTVVGHANHV